MKKPIRKLNIAIDGTAGSGKTTISKYIAKYLNYTHIDSGSIYRALAYKAIKNNIDYSNKKALIKLSLKTNIKYFYRRQKNRIYIDGKDITIKIRSEEVSCYVPHLARIKEIRLIVIKLQKKLAKAKGIVMEGRDIGTIVLPNADLKIFLDASLNERVKRRYKELKKRYKHIIKSNVKKEIINRDMIDKKRKFGTLKKAKNAVLIDTTGLTVKEAVEKIFQNYDTILPYGNRTKKA